MTIITKEYPLLKKEEDYYILDNIVSGGDLEIKLDKRLHILEDIFCVGSMDANCEIVVAGTIVAHGRVQTKGLQVDTIKALGRVFIDGDITTKSDAIFGSFATSGNMVSYGNLTFASQARIEKNIAVKGNLVAYQELFVYGKLIVEGLLDAKTVFYASEFRLNNVAPKDYGRFMVDGSTIAIIYDDAVSIHESTIGWMMFKSIEEAKSTLQDKNSSGNRREAISNTAKKYECMKQLTFTVSAPPAEN